MKVKICPKCGMQSAATAWNCENASCGEVLPMSTLVEAAVVGGSPQPATAGSAASALPWARSPAGPYVSAGQQGEDPAKETSRSRSGRLEVSGTGVVAFVLSVIAVFVGMGFLISGVAGGPEGVIRLSRIYMGLGLLVLAGIFTLWGIAEQLGRFWKHLRTM